MSALTKDEKNKTNIKKETIQPTKRILKDVINIYKNPLTENNIFYKHDDTDILRGYAMIIGPGDTIYAHGFYFFKFKFPSNYPFSPPKVTYLTNNGSTRFNPNLYRNGKVCVSILNTWSGPKWSSCQTIRSILLSLVTLFHNTPLTNEPGISINHRDNKPYNEILKFQSLNTAVYSILNGKIINKTTGLFREEYKKYFRDNHKIINELIDKYKNDYPFEKKNLNCSIYSMQETIDYDKLKDKINDPKILKEYDII